MNKEKYLKDVQQHSHVIRSKKRSTHKKKPWEVDNVQPRLTSSVVVTLVHVIHRERICPARRARIKFFVQRLFHLATKLVQNDPADE
jgi:hypothetical protein